MPVYYLDGTLRRERGMFLPTLMIAGPLLFGQHTLAPSTPLITWLA